jgi:multidrug resistance efflux pump
MENKDKLPPIPTPASQRWREFRIQVLPFVMFLGVIVAIVVLWKNYVQPIGVIGFAETNQVNVTSLNDGLIESLFVEPFQVVTQGQMVAIVAGNDPELIKAQNAALQAELEVQRDRLNFDITRVDQNIHDAEKQLQDYFIDQGADKRDWFLKSNELGRAQQEYTKKIISEADFDRIKNGFEVLSVKIAEREKAIDSQSKSLDVMRERAKNDRTTSVDAARDARSLELQLMLKPSYLKAPIDGMVSSVHHRKGERILRGDPIATIVDPLARRVIGYVRQPVSLLPTTNDSVTILKRTAPSAVAKGRIERVGAQFEFINPALLSSDTKRMEVGLPILVSVPPGFPLVPGEYVTLTIDYGR